MPTSITPELATALTDRVEKGGEWYTALYMAALDEMQDPMEALRVADEVYAKNPQGEQ